MRRLAFRGRARGGRALALLLLAVGGLAACGPEPQDPVAAASGVVPKGVPPGKAECRRFTTCVPENPCHTGWVTGCRKNVPICTDIGGWLSNGTSCGEAAVCYMGECEPCTAGQSCPIPDVYGNPDACRVGQISCDSGQPVCEDVGPAPDGTSCGGGGPYYCKGGACTWCQEGGSCTEPDQPCRQGIVEACATTGGTCADAGPLPNGSWCGYTTMPLVCRDGACLECAWGASCDPQGLQCQYGAIDCSSGWPVCSPAGWKPDETPCDGGLCMGGQCTAPCVPDQPCTPSYNACYAGGTVCYGPYSSYCEPRDPLPDGTSCGDSMICRAQQCTTCGPGSWCQSPDPCYGAGTLSCATGLCSPVGEPYQNGWTCGLAGETCQAGICTDDTDPRLVVRSASWSFDLTGTTWTRCASAAAGQSRRVTDTFGLGTGTHVVESFATPDCSGDVQATTGGDRMFASAGDRYVGWTGAPPSGAPGWVTATALRATGTNPDGSPIDVKNLYWVNDWTTPRQLFRGDPSKLGADGYPVSLLPDPNPFVQVLPPCIPDQPCTPANACYAGRTVCWDAYNGYCEQREPLPDGASCGTELVCSNGSCVSCGPAAACQSPDPCYASATISCATGRCEPLPASYSGDGLTCGVGGETCQGGTCTALPGADPWVRSTLSAVDLAGTTWFNCFGGEPEPGMSRMRIDTYLAAGITHQEVVFTGAADCTGPTDPARGVSIAATITSGGDRLASWSGGYVPPGLPGSPTATAMHVVAPDSPLGPIDFKELVFVHDAASPRQLYIGESKSPDFYPSTLQGSMPMAEVVACDPGAPCTPAFATCEAWRIDCSVGVPICAATGTFLADGTRCGDGRSWCQAGACVPVPTRTVTGTSQMTWWPDSGAVSTTDPSPLQSVAALQLAGGFAYHPGAVFPDGTFAIPDVEDGAYQLEAGLPLLRYFHETASAIDLGMDALGRPDVAWPTGPTPVWFDVKGLVPWTTGDVLEFASSNAGVAALPFGGQGSTGVPEEVEQLVGSFDWNGRPLVSGAAGDVAYVFQASTAWEPTGERVTAASRWTQLPGTFELADLVGGTVDVTLGACTPSGTVSADWRRSAFEAYAAMVHPDAVPLSHRIVVGARPHASPSAPGFRVGELAAYPGVPLLVAEAVPPASDGVLNLSYGRFLPPLWREYQHDRLMVGVSFTAPGAVRSARLNVTVGYNVAADRAPNVVAPLLAPPGDLTIGGLDAWSGAAGVGTRPRIAWTAPAVSADAAALFPGASLRYRVTVYEVRAAGDGTQLVALFDASTARTSLTLPGTNMYPGGRYVVNVEAALTVESLTAPLHASVERAFANVVSREFTP